MGDEIIPILIFLLASLIFQASISAYQTPLNCTDTTRLCTSFLAFKPTSDQTLPVIQSMFDVLQQDITVEGNGRDYIFIKKKCSCALRLKQYLTNTTFTVNESNGSVYDLVRNSYDGLAFIPSNLAREAKKGAVVSLRLMCGCSSGLWNYLMSYVMRDEDSVESLASKFGVSMDSIESVNGISNPDNVTVGELYFIPLNSVPVPVPGEPNAVKNDTPAPSVDTLEADHQVNHKSHHVPYWWIIGSLAVGLILIIVLVVIFVVLRSSGCFSGTRGSQVKDSDGKISHRFYILRNTSFCCASGRSISADLKPRIGESSNRRMNIPSVIGTDVFDMEKPVVFTYEEIISSTDGFSDSNLLGHGTYSSVYYGLLLDQEVAIKKDDCYKN